MEENNIIGLNPYEARNNIDYFNNKVNEAFFELEKDFNTLFENLNNNWNSPHAIQFANKITNLLNNIKLEINDLLNRINGDAVDAYNRMAYANGLDGIRYSNNVIRGRSIKYELKECGINGEIGMKISDVRDILMKFQSSMNNVINKFNSLPNSIALYDDENGQKRYFGTNVRKLGMLVENLVDDVTREISENINMEITNIENAKNNAVNTLNS